MSRLLKVFCSLLGSFELRTGASRGPAGISETCRGPHRVFRGAPDHRVLDWCIAEDRVIVAENAPDFRQLVGKIEIHPGLIILPAKDREGTWKPLQSALAFIRTRGDPMSVMVIHVLEVRVLGRVM